MGRGRAINKANAIITELLISLDDERGGEISKNLKRLYCYMQTQLSKAHVKQLAEPIVEVAALLTTLLERVGAARLMRRRLRRRRLFPVMAPAAKQTFTTEAYASVPLYGGYLDDAAAAYSHSAYSF